MSGPFCIEFQGAPSARVLGALGTALPPIFLTLETELDLDCQIVDGLEELIVALDSFHITSLELNQTESDAILQCLSEGTRWRVPYLTHLSFDAGFGTIETLSSMLKARSDARTATHGQPHRSGDSEAPSGKLALAAISSLRVHGEAHVSDSDRDPLIDIVGVDPLSWDVVAPGDV